LSNPGLDAAVSPPGALGAQLTGQRHIGVALRARRLPGLRLALIAGLLIRTYRSTAARARPVPVGQLVIRVRVVSRLVAVRHRASDQPARSQRMTFQRCRFSYARISAAMAALVLPSQPR
jgi:hypothetical protein